MSGVSEYAGSSVPGGMIVKETSNPQTRGSRQLDSGDRLARDETTEQSYPTLTLVDFASGALEEVDVGTQIMNGQVGEMEAEGTDDLSDVISARERNPFFFRSSVSRPERYWCS
ncbi:hypothetical protein CABS01_09293 [Colletotrichum abscissum]|uniref:Uncharacterized protein n=2 Tax=Colletotrichum acutatum species complex TaxID=2707335 RepID=A0AAJ0E0Y9_9PEZI|nr:uncharacterized protein CCOS01_06732 [Colletotrichum costaricense]XP_060400377.1 uncharacterized protein CABS01_09293 [Colletotrichum abscissum]KAK1455143.1 hypothetical protein CMEL01_03903 [Colletotrichum melonis]KAK1502682.1 hypothetical protein CABS01_09293 [Colletotrichum abscissum]KAK1528898.1 hypothetical protein CCOS01_06732 [Colletotrichum costaricense]